MVIIGSILLTDLSGQSNQKSYEKEFDRAELIFSKIYQNESSGGQNYSKAGYAEALPIFLRLYKVDQRNCNIAFKIGVCYQNSILERTKAIYYFNQATSSLCVVCKPNSYEEKSAPFITYSYLGDAYHLKYQFVKAITAYNEFISLMVKNGKGDDAIIKETKRKIEICNTAKLMVAAPIKNKITNLGSGINSPFADYSPVLSADLTTLFFTSRRPETLGDEKDEDGNNMEDIFMSVYTETGWTKAANAGTPINTEWHEASVGMSPDGQTILIYKDDQGDGNIYTTSLDGDIWTIPVKLNENINSKYWEPSAFISANGRTLYFTSNKPGGFGGRDLYVSKLLPNGDWGKAFNMGPAINTSYDEDAPFIHPDGVTLYFSSNGHKTMGGFDIFSSTLSESGIWSDPLNVGYPINTTDDDIYYVVSPNGLTAYFSSFRDGGFGGKDNYMVTFPDKKEIPLTLLKGIVNDDMGVPAKEVEITITDNETGEIAGVYRTNRKTGKFLFILTPGKNYNITYHARNHLFYSENMEIPKNSNFYEIKKAILLPPIVVGSKIVLNNIFFDFDKASLRALSNVELNNLALLLKANPNLRVEISGHTDSKGSDAYNQLLSEQRAQAVVDYLSAHEISSDRMKAKGYGKADPIASNVNADGTDNPFGRQSNRRVELTITEIYR